MLKWVVICVRLGLDEQPIIMLGQDEGTFHQFVFSKKNWKGSTGKSILLPKSRGESVMISGICGQEFGLGLGDLLTQDILNQINNKQRGKKYICKDSSLVVYNQEEKT